MREPPDHDSDPPFAVALRRLRVAANLTQEETANRAGVAVRTVRNLESGRVSPRSATVEMLVRGLRLDDVEALRLRRLRGAESTGDAVVTPRQLPAAVAHFTGRTAELTTLRRLVDRASSRTTPAAVVVVGPPGVGKTSLAVRFSRQVAHRFPDGQLFVNLRGHDAVRAPVTAVEAMARLLRDFGVAPAAIPVDPDELAARCRSVLAGRRALLLLDDAASAAQVLPLLPGASGVLTVITSRYRLDDLVVRLGVTRLDVDVMPAAEAIDLIELIVGTERVGREPAAAAVIARRCGYLPLAVAIIGANLAADPGRSFTAAADALSAGASLSALSAEEDGGGVRASVELSYRALSATDRLIWRALGDAPLTAIYPLDVSALLDLSAEDAQRHLTRLVKAHLLHPGVYAGYQFHDLLRLFAAERAVREDSLADRDARTQRLARHFAATARAAAARLNPQLLRLPCVERGPDFATDEDARRWLESQRPNVVAVSSRAADNETSYAYAWLLADALRGFFWHRRYHAEWAETVDAGLRAARLADDAGAQAAMYSSSGTALWGRGHYAEALRHFDRALAGYRASGLVAGEAATLVNMGGILRNLGRPRQALAYLNAGYRFIAKDPSGRLEAQVETNLATVHSEIGSFVAALHYASRALTAGVAMGSVHSEGSALTKIATIYLRLGDWAKARSFFDRALACERAAGAREWEGHCLLGLAQLAYVEDDQASAGTLASEAFTIADEIDDPALRVSSMVVLAHCAGAAGNTTEATTLLREAHRLARLTANRMLEIEALVALAETASARRAGVAAAAHATRAVALAREAGYVLFEGQALTALAHAQFIAGDPSSARSTARVALRRHRWTGHRPGIARTKALLREIHSASRA